MDSWYFWVGGGIVFGGILWYQNQAKKAPSAETKSWKDKLPSSKAWKWIAIVFGWAVLYWLINYYPGSVDSVKAVGLPRLLPLLWPSLVVFMIFYIVNNNKKKGEASEALNIAGGIVMALCMIALFLWIVIQGFNWISGVKIAPPVIPRPSFDLRPKDQELPPVIVIPAGEAPVHLKVGQRIRIDLNKGDRCRWIWPEAPAHTALKWQYIKWESRSEITIYSKGLSSRELEKHTFIHEANQFVSRPEWITFENNTNTHIAMCIYLEEN